MISIFDDTEDISDEYRRLMMLGEVDHRPLLAMLPNGMENAAWNKKIWEHGPLGCTRKNRWSDLVSMRTDLK